MNFAIIIARGGSKRLPRKNTKLFCGYPLVAWAIVQARCSETVDKVFVSTDDDEIANIAISYGAEVIRRPNWPNPDEIAGNMPVGHAIGVLKERYGDDFNEMVSMLPTVPLNKPGDIDELVRRRREIGADRISRIIPQRETCLYRLVAKNHARLTIFDKNYHYGIQPGGVVATTPESYVAFNNELPSLLDKDLNLPENWASIEYYWMPAEYWQYADVDTEEEFEFAQLVMEYYILKGKGMEVYEEYKRNWQNSDSYTDRKLKNVLLKYGNAEQL